MKTILILAAIAALGVLSNAVLADENQYQKLEIRDAQPIHISPEEASEANRQAVETFQKQLEMSDPETRAAILRAQRELQEKKAREQLPVQSSN